MSILTWYRGEVQPNAQTTKGSLEWKPISVIDLVLGSFSEDALLWIFGRGGRRTSPPHLGHRYSLSFFFALALVVAVPVIDEDGELPWAPLVSTSDDLMLRAHAVPVPVPERVNWEEPLGEEEDDVDIVGKGGGVWLAPTPRHLQLPFNIRCHFFTFHLAMVRYISNGYRRRMEDGLLEQ